MHAEGVLYMSLFFLNGSKTLFDHPKELGWSEVLGCIVLGQAGGFWVVRISHLH